LEGSPAATVFLGNTGGRAAESLFQKLRQPTLLGTPAAEAVGRSTMTTGGAMRRVLVLLSAASMVLLGLVGGGRGAPTATAREGTPEAPGVSGGMTVDHIAISQAGTLPAGPIALGVAQITLAPGGRLPIPGTNPVILYYVASGALTARVESEVTVDPRGAQAYRIAAGTEIALAPGDAIVVPANAVGELRDDGQTPAAILIAFVYSPPPAGMLPVETARDGTPLP
jgi:hypothetical protein